MILITQHRVGQAANEIIALHYAAREEGWDVLPAPNGWRLDEDFIKSGVKGVPYGSQLFCEIISQQMNWKLKANSFDWLAKLPNYFTQRKIEYMTLAEARKITERKFIKPADDKCFDAKVYEIGTFNPPDEIESWYPTLVSEPVTFDLEYRCFVDMKGVRTWSNYSFYGEINDPRHHNMVPVDQGGNSRLPHEFVNDLVHYIDFHTNVELEASVIDVGRIPGKGWAIIEANPAWASGLYGCDPTAAFNVMRQACE